MLRGFVRRSSRLQHTKGVFGVCFMPANHVGVVSQFGALTGTIVPPGLGVYLPMLQRVTSVSCAVISQSVEVGMYTKDSASVTLSVMIQWRVKPEHAADYLTKLDNPEAQLLSYVEKELRTAVSRRTLQELFGQQASISEEVEAALAAEMATYGITIVDTQINAVTPDGAIRASMAKVVSSQRNLDAARYQADATRIQLTAEAEAEARRKELQGQGTAAERRAVLSGLEDDLKHMSERLGIPPSDLMQYVLQMQNLDALARLAVSPNAKVLVWPAPKSRDTALALETAQS